ncbi:hypothetical protein [Rhizobium sp. J15]|uniref:hypothetical protein n=1 Tax=Rhizobium sp. J15 TaxID=2035450 RepID=UPI001AECFF16|nr:hypothetical protein [Rhizobium sp. J15]
MTLVLWLMALPFAAVFVAALIMAQGARLWISIAIAGAAVLAGAIFLYIFALEPSCRINEEECLGATAMAWFVAFVWSAPCVGFVLKLLRIIREGSIDSS